jgi:hypothetical protein
MSMHFSKRTLVLGGAAALGIGVGAGLLVSGQAEAAQPGQAAPNFSVVDAAGQTRTLSEFAGKTLILEWTNHGCPFVVRQYTSGNMQSVQRDAIADGAVWLQVISSAPGEQGHLDGAGALRQAANSNSAPSGILLDPTGVMGRAYGATATPHLYIIDAQGVLRYQGAIDDRATARASEGFDGVNNYVRAALADMTAGRAVRTASTRAYGCNVKYA